MMPPSGEKSPELFSGSEQERIHPMTARVPFVDLTPQLHFIRSPLLQRWGEMVHQSSFVLGQVVEEFEQVFAAYCGSRHAVGVGSGTEALHLALRALGVGRGDEVITAANSFVATAEAILHCGASPVFVDVDPRTYNLDPSQLEDRITARTKAVIPVHLYGQPADMDPILEVARAHDLYVIEDACQAHGAAYHGRRVGSLGDLACFSFYPSKNLGACGDAGAVVTGDAELARKLRKLRNHGGVRKYQHELVGFNSRLDALQAAALLLKLPHLDSWNRHRQACALLYNRLLSSVPGITTPAVPEGVSHVYHLYVIRTQTLEREQLQADLARHGVETGIHYPEPLSLMKPLLGFGCKSCPVAEQLAGEILSLPMFPGLSQSQINLVAEVIYDSIHRRMRRRSFL